MHHGSLLPGQKTCGLGHDRMEIFFSTFLRHNTLVRTDSVIFVLSLSQTISCPQDLFTWAYCLIVLFAFARVQYQVIVTQQWDKIIYIVQIKILNYFIFLEYSVLQQRATFEIRFQDSQYVCGKILSSILIGAIQKSSISTGAWIENWKMNEMRWKR